MTWTMCRRRHRRRNRGSRGAGNCRRTGAGRCSAPFGSGRRRRWSTTSWAGGRATGRSPRRGWRGSAGLPGATIRRGRMTACRRREAGRGPLLRLSRATASRSSSRSTAKRRAREAIESRSCRNARRASKQEQRDSRLRWRLQAASGKTGGDSVRGASLETEAAKDGESGVKAGSVSQ